VEEDIFKGYLTSIERLEKCEKVGDISHLAFLEDAKCILLHTTTEDWNAEKGFLSGSTSNVEKIRADIADCGDKIPLVLFSNGMGEPVYSYKEKPNIIWGIKKNILYEHLYDFVEHYKDRNEIELRILAWGRNFRAKEISLLANDFLETIVLLNGIETFEISKLSDKQQVFKTFIEISISDVNYQDILNNLENNPINIAEFRNKLNLIIESFLKYGKNIYPWK
jgi:hypothetical protein